MARRKSTEKHIRKLTRVGKLSMSVTIPIEYIRDLKWRERQKVVINKIGKRLIIEDWKKSDGVKRILDPIYDLFLGFFRCENNSRQKRRLLMNYEIPCILDYQCTLACVQAEYMALIIPEDWTAMIVRREVVIPEYLAYAFKTNRIQRWFGNNKRGATIKGVPRNDVTSLLFPLPDRLEQKDMVDSLHGLDSKIGIGVRKFEILQGLFHGMLHELMTGRIRVKDLEVSDE